MSKEDYFKYYIQGSDHYLIPKDVFDELFDEMEQLQQENQSLKKENKILRENAEHNDKVVDKAYWENQKLKKQVEEYKRLGFKHLNDKCNKLENQQVENLVLAKCIKNIDPWSDKNTGLEIGKYYVIEEINIGQSKSSIKINGKSYNSILFEYYNDYLEEIDIYKSYFKRKW